MNDYVSNVVTCKLWGLVGSPIELILGLAIFKKLHSSEEFAQEVVDFIAERINRVSAA